MPSYASNLDEIRAASRRIEGFVHRTPVLRSRSFDERSGCSLFFKCENFQGVGAFKLRGATNAVLQLDALSAARGVVTHSSGNHAQALALAARRRGIAAHIVMPNNAPAIKRQAVLGYGAKVYDCEPTLAAREATAQELLASTGATFIPPYNHPHIIAGQGTVMLELMEEVEALDAVIAPVGGGGLLSGVALAAHGLDPELRVFGAEPTGADDAARSKAAGELLPQTGAQTTADGLLTSLGDLTWPVVRDLVDTILTVGDDETLLAMRMVYERMKLVIEPSAAVAVAAALRLGEESGLSGARVGVVLSGGNVELAGLFDTLLPITPR